MCQCARIFKKSVHIRTSFIFKTVNSCIEQWHASQLNSHSGLTIIPSLLSVYARTTGATGIWGWILGSILVVTRSCWFETVTPIFQACQKSLDEPHQICRMRDASNQKAKYLGNEDQFGSQTSIEKEPVANLKSSSVCEEAQRFMLSMIQQDSLCNTE